MRWLVLLALLLPGVAWADPFSAIALLSSLAATAGVITATTAFFISIGSAVIGSTIARRKARRAAAAQRAQYNASLQDRTVSVLRGDPPWQVIYGRCIVGGAIVDIFSTDKTARREDGTTYTKADGLKHIVIVLAAHECQAINEVYLDGVAVGTLDVNGLPTGGEFAITRTATRQAVFTTTTTLAETPLAVLSAYSTTGTGIDLENTAQTVTISGNDLNGPGGIPVVANYTVADNLSVVRVQKMLGTTTQARNTYLGTVAPTRYTTNHRLRELCYIVVTLDLEDSRFQGGPPNITADVTGKLVYDTRISGPAAGLDYANPALVVRDFLLAPWGFEAASADVDTAFCNAAANACDADISLDVGGTVTTGQDTYTCNGAFTTDASPEAVLEDLVECMAGTVVYGATWQISAGVWTAPVMTLTDDDLNGVIEVLQADTSTEDLFNGVRGQYVARGAQTPSDFNPYANATFVTADGRALWTNVTLPFTDNLARARNLCRIFVERNREGQTIRFPAKLRAWVLQVGDRVTVTSAEYGFSAKTYRVTDWQFDVTSAVVLTLQEDIAAIYDLADAAVANPAPNTTLPNPWLVSSIAGLAALSDNTTAVRNADGGLTPRVRVSWTAVTDNQVLGGGRIDILWRRNAVTAWQIVPALGSDTQAWITGVKEGDRLVIKAVAVNKYNARSAPVQIAHTVNGKSSAPSTVAGLAAVVDPDKVRITWTASTDTDYEATELRHGASWAGGFLIWRGKGNAYSWFPAGTNAFTIWARHFDRSGNSSTTDATVAITYTLDPTLNRYARVSNITGSPITCVARLRLQTDGNIARTLSGSSATFTNFSTPWYTPAGGTPGNDYWVRFVQRSGAAVGGAALNTWLALSTDQPITLTATSLTSREAIVDYQIATSSGGTTVVSTGTFDLYAESS